MKVFWTALAIDSFHRNIEYLEEKWSSSEIDFFLEKTDEAIEIIALYPRVFPVQNQEFGIRKCVIVSQVSLYYMVKEEQIDLLLFWKNVRNPEILKKTLKTEMVGGKTA